jgi:hypothetical protein
MHLKTTSIILFVLCSTLYGYSQIKSGITLGVGRGGISNVVFPDDPWWDGYPIYDLAWEYRYNKMDLAIGFKHRIESKNKPFFYDIDFNVGLKRYSTFCSGGNYDYDEMKGEHFMAYFEHNFYSLSFNPTWNYRLIRGLHAGAGIEPILYFQNNTSYWELVEHWKFDLPLTAKIGYDFRSIDFSISYKHGLFNTMERKYFKSAKYWSVLLSVFIPICLDCR